MGVRRRMVFLPVLTGLAAVLAGCGIRPTEVPTDFGPAPSRARCSLAGPDVANQTSRGMPVRVFLLCGSSLVAVDRTIRVPEVDSETGRRVLVAQGLLDELARTPTTAAREAGYATAVRPGTRVSGPRRGDPEDALRLSSAPGDLSAYALAQIVCTFSDSAAAGEVDGSVVLGGPESETLRRYECTEGVRARPGAGEPPSGEVSAG
ncbi:hypothetical protein [Streptomyces sp. NPDC006997]|uniref:hypothetical protein n=1 Tax=Streptomyces sp. NPDC006997 TaxID=3155356 RepID=UPI0033C7E57B